MPVTFVYRTHYVGPLGKRVVQLPDTSILAWFQRVWSLPSAARDAELGGRVYGLDSVFKKAAEKGFPAPKTYRALKVLLDDHLYVEGSLKFEDEHALRVQTDDDEVQLAYFFLDDTVPRDRLAFALQEWPLPGGADPHGSFTPAVPTTALGPAGGGTGVVYAVLLTFYDSDSFGTGGPWSFPGVRLPELLAYFRRIPGPEIRAERSGWVKSWPIELRLLRAMVEPGDTDLRPALERCNAYRGLGSLGAGSHSRLGLADIAAGRREFDAAASSVGRDGDPTRSLLDVGAHHAFLARHATAAFGYQPWFLFDDAWAAANAPLAQALLRWDDTWDLVGP